MKNINYKFDSSEENKSFLYTGLENHNFPKNEYLNPKIYQKDKKYFGFYAYEDDIIIGGAYGWIEYENWVKLSLLYVDDNYRNFDIGTKLIKLVEDFSKENKVTGIIVNTWDFQARGFYEKMGFTLYAQLEDYPIGATFLSLKKVMVY
jgi:Acetyltransferases